MTAVTILSNVPSGVKQLVRCPGSEGCQSGRPLYGIVGRGASAKELAVDDIERSLKAFVLCSARFLSVTRSTLGRCCPSTGQTSCANLRKLVLCLTNLILQRPWSSRMQKMSVSGSNGCQSKAQCAQILDLMSLLFSLTCCIESQVERGLPETQKPH
jgi:hypothetical protein